MMQVLLVSMNLNGLEMQKMLSSLLKKLINIEFYFSQSMNIAQEVAKVLIMY